MEDNNENRRILRKKLFNLGVTYVCGPNINLFTMTTTELEKLIDWYEKRKESEKING